MNTTLNGVLILILMEHAQRDQPTKFTNKSERNGLNPYFNGTCSKSLFRAVSRMTTYSRVLILILMEHAQREPSRFGGLVSSLGLNPYFNGTCSKSFSTTLLIYSASAS